MYFLSKELFFPPVYQANNDGILDNSGDFSTERLMMQYQSGLFTVTKVFLWDVI